MTMFQVVPVARSSPTECALCKTPLGPFLDTGVEKLEGRILICTSITGPDGEQDRSGCVEQMARLAGSVDKEIHDDVLVQRDGLRERVTELEAAIADREQPQVNFEKLTGRLEQAVERLESRKK